MPTKRATPVKPVVLVEEKKRTSNKKASKKKVVSRASEPVKKVKISNRSKKVTPKIDPLATHLNVQDSTPSSTPISIAHNKVQLALLSPFRFPIDNDRLASQVARFAGVFFVVVGAIFTILNLEYVDSETFGMRGSYNVAETISTDYNCTDSSSPNYNPTYCTASTTSGVTNPPPTSNPPVDIVLDAREPFANTVPVNIFVPYATEVIVYAKHMQGMNKYSLGAATKVSDTSWRFYWQTMQYPDGLYTMVVFIKSSSGQQYEYIRPNTVSVLNYPISTPGTTGTTSSTTSPESGENGNQNATTTTIIVTTPSGTTTASSTPPEAPKVLLTIPESSPLHGDATLKVVAMNASSVKLHARKHDTNAYSFLGYATNKGNGEWRYEWNTELVTDGTYIIKGQAIYGDTSYITNTLTIAVNNSDEVVSTTTPKVVSATTTPMLEPEISITIPKQSPLMGDNDVLLSVLGATFVEVYALPKNSLTPRYLGLAEKQNTTDWRYRWNTKQTPNGEYVVFAKVKHTYGLSDSRRVPVTVKNEVVVTQTEEQAKTVSDLQAISTVLKETVVPQGEPVPPSSQPQIATVQPIYLTPVKEVVNEIDVTDEEMDSLSVLLQEFRSKIEKDLNKLAKAIRNGDEDEIKNIKAHIESIRQDVIETLPVSKEKGEIIAKIDEHLKKVVNELQELALRNEQIIKERVGDAINKDSDKDGISDYDEVNLYNTDPFNPDSDGDSFIDGTEVMAGYDPTNSKPEVLVAYESPQEIGVVREDLLSVNTIFTIPKINSDSTVADDTADGAIISGKGLPNSFLTLYIYSTPIVVTVKTDENGSWSYTFDKELDNGEHEVYVGMTDNAGRIVAKSNPLTFVKTAQAFTPVDAAGAVAITESAEPSLINQNMLLVIVSIAVVAIGLVLILLGLHVNSRRILEPVTQ